MVIPSQVRAKLCAMSLYLILALFCIGGASSPAKAREPDSPCPDPLSLSNSVVSVTWYYSTVRRDAAGSEFVGERATAWFFNSPRLLITAAHFAGDLAGRGWQKAELHQAPREGEPETVTHVQLRVLVQDGPSKGRGSESGTGADSAEDLAMLELRDPFPNARMLEIQPAMPAKDAMVLILGYPGGRLRAARGVIRQAEDHAGRFAGLAFLEVEGPNRLVLNAGSSGAPVLDCRLGGVIGVLNGLLTGPPLPFLPPGTVIPTPWGSPTNTAVPISTLRTIWRSSL